ncbi:MAG: hypothetical protein HN457_15615 [Opitutales bacterium]|jgi:hypothetical protein|nr:hypothetical protein [Opitutales bacterium]MDG2255907.1 hypothetical protein [Opitutaceae bacterium]
MEPEQMERILKEHIRLCSDLHDLFIEEGKIMRSTGTAPDEDFLKKKQEFLPALDKGLELLQRINEDPTAFDRSVGPLVEEARSQVMKLMMLDRENERLLLKTSLPPKMKQAYGKAAAGQVAKAYSKYAKG